MFAGTVDLLTPGALLKNSYVYLNIAISIKYTVGCMHAEYGIQFAQVSISKRIG